MDFSPVGKWIFFIGIGLIILGLFFWFGSKFFPLGRMPGDIKIEKEKFSFYFPLITSIVVSLLLTIVINLIIWIFRK